MWASCACMRLPKGVLSGGPCRPSQGRDAQETKKLSEVCRREPMRPLQHKGGRQPHSWRLPANRSASEKESTLPSRLPYAKNSETRKASVALRLSSVVLVSLEAAVSVRELAHLLHGALGDA